MAASPAATASPASHTTSDGSDPVQPMPIVGIGASAGGVGALRTFFGALPSSDSETDDEYQGDRTAYVVILHLPPEGTSNLVGILQQETALRVRAIEDEDAVRPGTIYVISPGQRLTLDEGRLHVRSVTDAHDALSVDRFLRSLADDQGANAVGIVLSGTGTDGTLGLRAIKEAGGITMVQSPSEAEYPQMPESALATGIVDLSLPAAQLAEKLAEYRDQAGVIQLPESEDGLEKNEKDALPKIFKELRTVTGHDFSGYKHSTVLRRLERRLQLRSIKTLTEYVDVLRSTPDEAEALKKDLLISVTSFFRNEAAFQALEESVIPALFDGKSATDTVRVWVPGCATGEEAYSIAMLLVEHAQQRDDVPDLQVFATDVDTEALALGRKGLYPKAIEADVSTRRLEQFFQPDGDHYRINQGLREHVLFAEHNLLEDPPFSNLDLVSCRNLLIYLNAELQRHVYQLFHYSLRTHGHLFLGRSEALGSTAALFETIDASTNVLRARDLPKGKTRKAAPVSLLQRGDGNGASRSRRKLLQKGSSRPSKGSEFALQDGQMGASDLERETEVTVRELHRQALMQEVASVLVTEDRSIVHISGAADRYLQFGEGLPTQDLLSCVPETLRAQLRSAVYKAFKEGVRTHRDGIMLKIEGTPRRLSLSVRPLETDGVRYVHVRFEDLSVGDNAPFDVDSASDREAQLLEELERTREQLQTTAEEHEAVAEEMETANEELLSMNEELQSKNEELQTNEEEIQSVNEELKTTNRELKDRIEEVNQSNAALESLMASTEIATLFLDADLELQRYTPAAATLFGLDELDIGKPLGTFTTDFDVTKLAEEAKRASRDEKTIEREVRRGSDEWYLARMRPHRTVDGDVAGAVVTFIDITERRLLERQVINTTEKVRRRIGQDLHDILSSDLTAVAMMLQNYERRLRKQDVDTEPLLKANKLVQKAAVRARTLSHALVPVSLQEENLAAALSNLCDEQAETTNLAITMDRNRGEHLPENKETAAHLYRIAREAIVNARRHASADQIRVRLERKNGNLEMTIRDNGVGMPSDVSEGLGLRTMRYRANLIGASLSFENGPDPSSPDADENTEGTTVRCLLPLSEAEAR